MKLISLIITINIINLLNLNLGFGEEGKAIFEKKCSICNTIGQGVKIGPDLKDVYKRRTEDWLRRMIKEPDKMIEEKDTVALQLFKEFKGVAMPNLGLKDEELDLIITFLKSFGEVAKVEKKIIQSIQKGEGGAIFGFIFLLILAKVIWHNKIKDVRLLLIQKSMGG